MLNNLPRTKKRCSLYFYYKSNLKLVGNSLKIVLSKCNFKKAALKMFKIIAYFKILKNILIYLFNNFFLWKIYFNF